MIFDINEGVYDDYDVLSFNSIREEACDFDDPILASGWVGVNIDATFNRLMEATAVAELHAVQETGTMAIYEVDMSGAKDRIKAWFESAKKMFKKIAQYIKGFFVKVFKMLESVFATGLKISRDNYEIFNNMDSDVMDRIHFSGYEYDEKRLKKTTNVKELIEDSISLASSDIIVIANDARTNKIYLNRTGVQDDLKEARGKVFNFSKDEIASDALLRDKLFAWFRGDASGPKTLNAGDVYGSTPTKVLDIMAGKKAYITNAKMDYKEAQQLVNDCITYINDLEKEVLKIYSNASKNARDRSNTNTENIIKTNKGYAMKLVSNEVEYLKGVNKILNVAHSEHIKAIKGCISQARSVAQAMIRKGTKIKDLGKSAEERYNESVYFNDDYNNDSYSEYMNIEF